jgi:hypothetical protein
VAVLLGDPNINPNFLYTSIHFPSGNSFSLPADIFKVQINRNPGIFPIAGDTTTGKARFLWIDLGLGQFSVVLSGPFRNMGLVSSAALEAEFLTSWKASVADTNDNVDRSKLIRVDLIDPRNLALHEFWCIARNFRRSQSGGAVAWEYQLTLDIVVMPCANIGTGSFSIVQDMEQKIGIIFPTAGSTLLPTDEIVISDNRTAAVVPLVGNSDDGCPNFFWTDLGLTEIDIQLHGLIGDLQYPDIFELMAQFLKSWVIAKAGDNQRGGIEVPYLVVNDPQGSLVYRVIPRTLEITRIGGTSRWEYRMSVSGVDVADLSG